MSKAINLRKNLVIFGIPLLIIGLMIVLTNTSLFRMHPNKLAVGITFDLLITVPFLYFLLIRKTSIPKTSIVLFLILGVVICSVILPPNNQQLVNIFKTWILPLVEFSIILYVGFQVRKAVNLYKLKKEVSADFFTALKNTCTKILPKGAVTPIVTELAVFYYGFVYWKKRALKDNEFSYHKNSGTIALLMSIMFMVAIETVVFHIFLAKWSTIVAWIFTFLSMYTEIQIFGFLKSMFKRPISIEHDQLLLRYGILSEAIIALTDIDSVEISSKEIEFTKNTRKLSPLGDLESHNTILHLKKENTLVGLYGIKRKFTSLAFYVDDNIKFKDQLNYTLLLLP